MKTKAKVAAIAMIGMITGTNAQDLISGGTNSWIFHTPDDGRKNMFIAPKKDEAWDWSKATNFFSDGSVLLNGVLKYNGLHGVKLMIEQVNWQNHNIIETGSDSSNGDWTEISVPGPTQNSANLRLNKYGNVGIGTTTPSAKLDVNGDIKTNNGRMFLRDNSIEEWKTNGNAQIAINYLGYNGGATQYRDFSVYDGKSRRILLVEGSTGNVAIDGKLETTGNVAIADKLEVNGNIKTNNGSLVLRNNSLEEWKTNGDAQIAVNYFGYNGGTTKFRDFSVYNGKSQRILLVKGSTGNVAIDGKLETKELKVTTTPTADFVFEEDYSLPTLAYIEKHIKEKKHLPEIASAKEMEKNGVNVGNFQIKLLQKIEELTLYTIEQEKKIKKFNSKVEKLKEENELLKSLNAKFLQLQKRVEELESK